MGIYQDQILPRITDAVMNRREFALENYHAQGPKPYGYMFEGVALKP